MEQKLGFLIKYKRNAQPISCHEINKLDGEKYTEIHGMNCFKVENVDKRVERYFIDMEISRRQWN